MLVVLVNMLDLPDVAENGRLRVIELFAGVGNIWRVAKKRGLVACFNMKTSRSSFAALFAPCPLLLVMSSTCSYASVGQDLSYDSSMDICAPSGFVFLGCYFHDFHVWSQFCLQLLGCV